MPARGISTQRAAFSAAASNVGAISLHRSHAMVRGVDFRAAI
jgi:hypothetical protein